MTVVARSEDGGILSYQWFSNTISSTEGGTLIPNADKNQYTPEITATGIYYYFVVITNTNPFAEIKTTQINGEVIQISLSPRPNAAITVNPETKFQFIRGFGGMDTPWNNTGATVELSLNDYETMFDPDKLGYNIMRIMIMPNNTNHNTTIDNLIRNPGGSRRNYLEGVKIVNKHGGYVLATPWTPPAAWKYNNHTIGQTRDDGLRPALRRVRWQDYANYLRQFAQVMGERGAPIYAISIQNEPNGEVGYDGCLWTPEEMRDFFIEVGHFTTGVPGFGGGKATPHVLTMNGETMHCPDINIAAMDNPISRNNIDLLGRHIYGWRMQRTINQHGKEMWMTEYNINTHSDGTAHLDSTWDFIWIFMNSIDLTLRLNDENAYIWWTSKRFYSLLGDGAFGTQVSEILPRGHGLSHFAKFAKYTNRIGLSITGFTGTGSPINTIGSNANVNHGTFTETDTDAYVNSVKVMAFESLDGNSISLVMYTPTRQDGTNGIDMGTIRIQLPAGFIASSAIAMRSNSSVKSLTESVMLSNDRNSAYVSLPASNILSVKFTR
jgi:O-glycosyl hydrolase